MSGGTINCDCHGSQYSIENGDVEQGPATFPLAEVPITVSGDEISLRLASAGHIGREAFGAPAAVPR